MKRGGSDTVRKAAIVLLLLLAKLSFGQSSSDLLEIEFLNQPIRDIVLALGAAAGESVIADETVGGTASYYFRNVTFEDALEAFLPAYQLHWWEENGVYRVSKIRSDFNPATGLLSVEAQSVPLEPLLRRIADAIDRSVVYDQLPSGLVNVNARELPPERVLQIATRRFPQIELVVEEDHFFVRRLPQDRPQTAASAPDRIDVADDRFSVDARRVRYSELVDELFAKAGREYLMLKRGDVTLETVRFEDKSFAELLRLISDLSDADFREIDGIYYIFELARSEIEKRLDAAIEIPLEHLAASEVSSLLPASLSGGNFLNVDEVNNSIILVGSRQEIEPIAAFVRRLDRPTQGRSYRRFDLSYMTAEEVLAVMPEELGYSPAIVPPAGNTFLMLLGEAQFASVRDFVDLVDRNPAGELIPLRFIRAEDLIQNLPPSVNEEDIVTAGLSDAVFFRGSPEKRRQFLRDLEELDTPAQQVRYELLVVQYQESDTFSYDFSAESDLTADDQEERFAGSIGNLLNVNFDVVSNFGYTFAIRLNSDIGKSKARVIADTTLNGVSGEELTFQNTNTFRYRETEIDPDTGEPRFTGITREIVSGLILEVNGWVSGDGMVTMDVSATISRRGADTTSTTGNPPPTSEKVVTTQVRTQSGEPVVIGGLLQQEVDLVESRAPIFSRIPLIGRLFRSQNDSAENTEFTIYIVPHVEYTEYGTFEEHERFRRYYRELMM